jgi:DNA polymerase-3 subunit gamma/tau
MSQALYRKYRPSKFKEVSGQSHVVQTICNQIIDCSVAHAYLFSGPRGVGKTTIARLLAKTINCKDRKKNSAEACGKCDHCVAFDKNSAMDIIEIDAASHTGVDNVRENIIEAMRFAPVSGEYKVFIIDEVHMLSSSAFNALLKTLEEPPAYGIFILATTEIHKIPQTIISRCQRFDFHRLTSNEIVERLLGVLKGEKIDAPISVLESIAKLSDGCLRDAESLLGQILALGENKITEEIASIILPQTNSRVVEVILGACDAKNAKTGILELTAFVESGGSVKHLNDDLIEECRVKMMKALDLNVSLAKKYSHYLEEFLKARVTPSPESILQLPLELAIINICYEDGNDEECDKKLDANDKEKNNDTEKTIKAVVENKTEDSTINFDIEELKSKWQRCIEETAKKNIALPLVLGRSQPIEVNSNGVVIGFDTTFHFETVNQPKNLSVLSEAIEKVMQCKVNVFAKLAQKELSDKPLRNLVEAFGGLVVE